jgi:hypothetical protein
MTIPHMSHAYLTHGTHAVRANQWCQRTTNQPGKGRVSYTGMQAWLHATPQTLAL